MSLRRVSKHACGLWTTSTVASRNTFADTVQSAIVSKSSTSLPKFHGFGRLSSTVVTRNAYEIGHSLKPAAYSHRTLRPWG